VVVLPRYNLALSLAKPSMVQFVSNAIVWLANGKTPVPGTHTKDQVEVDPNLNKFKSTYKLNN
jgi:hypothetical protein